MAKPNQAEISEVPTRRLFEELASRCDAIYIAMYNDYGKVPNDDAQDAETRIRVLVHPTPEAAMRLMGASVALVFTPPDEGQGEKDKLSFHS